MWNLKEKVIPVITRVTGTISKSLSNIPGKHEIKELQKKKKTAILGTARILRKVLLCKSTKHISRAKLHYM
jgi:hypothetical protein